MGNRRGERGILASQRPAVLMGTQAREVWAGSDCFQGEESGGQAAAAPSAEAEGSGMPSPASRTQRDQRLQR